MSLIPNYLYVLVNKQFVDPDTGKYWQCDKSKVCLVKVVDRSGQTRMTRCLRIRDASELRVVHGDGERAESAHAQGEDWASGGGGA